MYRLSIFLLLLVALIGCSEQGQPPPLSPEKTEKEQSSEVQKSPESGVYKVLEVVKPIANMPAALADGTYVFSHRFAEHPNMKSISLEAIIKNGEISLINKGPSDIFSKGVIKKGEMFWHEKSGEWIILSTAEDKHAEHVGGCTDGPEVIDMAKKIYWTC